MRRLITRIKNIVFLRKALREDLKDMQFLNAINTGRHFYKNFKKRGCERNMLAAFIKKYRHKEPYRVKGWADNEKLFKEYSLLSGAIKSLEEVKDKMTTGDVYVTMFRSNSYYKGKKAFEYGSVGTSLKNPVTLKVGKYRERYNSFLLNKDSLITLDEEWMRAFRYSTEEEIYGFKEREKRQKEIHKLIELKQQEISKLYNQLQSL